MSVVRRRLRFARWGAVGCGALRADAVEHYVFRPAVLRTARRHLHLGLGAACEGGLAVLGRLGIPGEQWLRLALHLDAPLAHNRVRHGLGGTGQQTYAQGLAPASPARAPAAADIVASATGPRAEEPVVPHQSAEVALPQGVGDPRRPPCHRLLPPASGALLPSWLGGPRSPPRRRR